MDVISRIVNGSIPEPNSGCWIWLGAVYRSGRRHEYGFFSLKNKRTSVHRASYEAMREQIPKGMVCRHICDNSLCVNPDHLVLGTQADNVRDMFVRKRSHQIIDKAVGQRAALNANDTMKKQPERRARGSRHGMFEVQLNGEQNGFSSLDAPTVLLIRQLANEGVSQRKIAKQFNTSQRNVWRIIHREGWKHV